MASNKGRFPGVANNVIGNDPTDAIAFYGTAPVTQQAAVTTVTTTAATTTSPWGFSTSTQADAIVTGLNAVISRLSTLGLTA